MFPKIPKSKIVIYLDHAATTPVDKEVVKVMQPFWSEQYGNPASLYSLGQAAARALTQARFDIAQILSVQAQEVVFTAGGTESVNLAILGLAKTLTPKAAKPPHFITSTIEHHAVLHSFDEVERMGFATTRIGVDAQGIINPKELLAAIRPETVFVSVMYANNEIGSIQPIAEIGRLLSKENQRRIDRKLQPIVFHTDACQGVGVLDVNVHKLGVDLLSGNASKMYGPKQVGFLYVRSGVSLAPILYGGGQEKNLRSGTENVAGYVGLAKSLSLAQKNKVKETKRLTELRNYLITELFERVPDIELNGPAVVLDKKNYPIRDSRLASNVNVAFRGVEGESLMIYLDSYNIAVSTGSACTAESPDPSHVILALGKSADVAKSSIRFSLGGSTTKQQLRYVLKVLPPLVAALRNKK